MYHDIFMKFMTFNLDIRVEPDGDDYIWWVFDIENDHIKLLNDLLHENHDEEIRELIDIELKEIKRETDLERQLAHKEDIERERFVFKKHGLIA